MTMTMKSNKHGLTKCDRNSAVEQTQQWFAPQAVQHHNAKYIIQNADTKYIIQHTNTNAKYIIQHKKSGNVAVKSAGV